jgi:hypothetical protein
MVYPCFSETSSGPSDLAMGQIFQRANKPPKKYTGSSRPVMKNDKNRGAISTSGEIIKGCQKSWVGPSGLELRQLFDTLFMCPKTLIRFKETYSELHGIIQQ